MTLKDSRASFDEAKKTKNGRQKNGRGKMKRKTYEKELHKLQVRLCHLQEWVREKGLRVIILFEGRDAAGKGGTIKAITERVTPRVFRVVASPPLLIARKLSCICSVTSNDFRPPVKS